MKPSKGFRGAQTKGEPEETSRKAVKLPPIKKSGKDKHQMYSALEEEDDMEAFDYRERESVFDYFEDETDL